MKVKLYLVLLLVFTLISFMVRIHCSWIGMTVYWLMSGIAAIPFLIIQGGRDEMKKFRFFTEGGPLTIWFMMAAFIFGPIGFFSIVGSRIIWKVTYGDSE